MRPCQWRTGIRESWVTETCTTFGPRPFLSRSPHDGIGGTTRRNAAPHLRQPRDSVCGNVDLVERHDAVSMRGIIMGQTSP